MDKVSIALRFVKERCRMANNKTVLKNWLIIALGLLTGTILGMIVWGLPIE